MFYLLDFCCFPKRFANSLTYSNAFSICLSGCIIVVKVFKLLNSEYYYLSSPNSAQITPKRNSNAVLIKKAASIDTPNNPLTKDTIL